MATLIKHPKKSNLLAFICLMSLGLSAASANPPEVTQISSGGIWRNVNCNTLGTELDYEVNPANLELSKYGGWKEKQVAATGFFRVQQINDRWWVVDPEGYLYVHLAINSVNLDHYTADQIYQNLKGYGFNGFGNWTDENIVSGSTLKAQTPMAYTPKLSFIASYRSDRLAITGRPRIELPVWDNEFIAYANNAAQYFTPYINDPHVFGYFSDNELPFKEALAAHLAITDVTDPNYIKATQFITSRGVTASTYTDADLNAYMGLLAERYYSIVSAAIKAVDPNHLYIGSRCHSLERESQEFMTSAGLYVDVFSANLYNRWGKVSRDTHNMSTWSGRPLIVSEFYTRGADTGIPPSGAGFEGIDQRARALFYQNFLTGFLETKDVVGFHWFKFQDGDDGGNKGVYSATGVPYTQLLNSMKQMNGQVYDYIDFLDKRPAPVATLNPEADAYFKHNTNYGSDPELLAKATTGTTLRESYLRFDVSTITAPVRKAYVSLKSTNINSEIGSFVAQFVANDTWGETTITRSNAPPGSATLHTWGYGRSDVMIDVTNIVKEAIAGDDKISLRIFSDLENGAIPAWASREHPTSVLRPELIIYAVDTGRPYEVWAATKNPHPGAPSSNPDKDSINNLMEFSFGLDPNFSDSTAMVYNPGTSTLTSRGTPIVLKDTGSNTFSAYFLRRKNSNLDYGTMFSSDLSSWTKYLDLPTIKLDANDFEVVNVPFPTTLTTRGFFSLEVKEN